MNVWVITVHCRETSGYQWDYVVAVYADEATARSAFHGWKDSARDWNPADGRPQHHYELQRHAVIESEVPDPVLQWFWVSFTDSSRPQGSQFLGVVIVEGFQHPDPRFAANPNVAGALAAAHVLGINPGGEAAVAQIPDEMLRRIPEHLRGVLLSREQATALAREL